MKHQGIELKQEICCQICLDVPEDPVTISCGHCYCMKCIQTPWYTANSKIYTCTMCRYLFTPRSVLMLSDSEEELKKTRHHAAPQHHKLPLCKKRKLVEPSKTLQENICTRHDEVTEIPYLCTVDVTQGHGTVSAADERMKRTSEPETSPPEIQHRFQDGEEGVKELQQDVDTVCHSADEAVEDSENFTELTHLLENRSSDVEQQIRPQQTIKEFQEKLQQKVNELQRRDTKPNQFLHMQEDLKLFLLNYLSQFVLKR